MRKEKLGKKILVYVLTVSVLAMLAGCGGSVDDQAEVKGEVFDAGQISALAPKGWMAFPVPDAFDAHGGENKPDEINICKDAKNQWDMFNNPMITITYFGPDKSFTSAKSFYEDVEDIAGFTLGNYEWTGFRGTSLGDAPYTILETTDGEIAIQVAIMEKSNNEKLEIKLDDADVQAIVASITVK